MIPPAKLFAETEQGDVQKKAHEMMLQFIVANGSNLYTAEGHFKILSEKMMGLNVNVCANDNFTKGVYALAHFVDGMKSAYTAMSYKGSCLSIVLRANKTWTDFINEFKQIPDESE